ncbi:hypothetical protein FXN63_26080 [Pigmentiphaga aceris]|uniref:Nitrate/nitrite sensing protein domain-containing protein n=1 Tax=Pigmentiphaga aceris TaxID=1940612 RepID=A0A5C0B506_9BURK|nr:nitrate- and nitrite sensing domain-containing protein [Pigmentiphaga aceris]QEI08936.1 hypothetical protein FXN63_26080 [Pigmentiphaga aceris]
MVALVGSLSGIAVAAGVLSLAWMGQEKQRRHLRQTGLAAVRESLACVTAVQQHRGMSVALLNGDKAFGPRLSAKQTDVDAALHALGARIDETPALAVCAPRRDRITAEWRQLAGRVQDMTPEQSFAAHTGLVQQMLYLLGDLGEQAGLLAGGDGRRADRDAERRLVQLLLQRLPPLVEHIGQARALGSGFAARGHCGAVGRIRLRFLAQRIGTGQEALSALIDMPDWQRSAQAQAAEVAGLLALIDTRLIGTDRIDLSSAEYFRSATQTIDVCLALWQRVADEVEGRLAGGVRERTAPALSAGLAASAAPVGAT